MIRDSYSQPQDNAPYTPAYDMDIDIPIPEDEPDNGAIVSPEELMQDPPELFTPDAETAPAETAAPAAPASEPVSPAAGTSLSDSQHRLFAERRQPCRRPCGRPGNERKSRHSGRDAEKFRRDRPHHRDFPGTVRHTV